MTFWPYQPTRASLAGIVNGEPVYRIGRYLVTVHPEKAAEDEGAVTYQADRSASSRPQASLPNMEIVDGIMQIPISDFIDEVMARATPLEIAQGLFASPDVRQHVIEALAERWSQDHFDDADRRKFLYDVQCAVHSKAVDDLANRIGGMEWHNSQQYYHRDHTSNVNRWLHDHDIDLRIPYEPESPDFKIGGKSWHEARDNWRKLVLSSFPPPDEPKLHDGDDEL